MPAVSTDTRAVPAAVSKTCLVRFDNNKYSVVASAVGRPVEVHAYADRIVIRQDGRIVAGSGSPRSFGRGDTPAMMTTPVVDSPARAESAVMSSCKPAFGPEVYGITQDGSKPHDAVT